jgi:hypothetical protein
MVQKKYPHIFQMALYGDAYHNEYNLQRAKYVDAVSVTDKNALIHPNMFWFPPQVFSDYFDNHNIGDIPWENRAYAVVFCGNNRGNRKEILDYLHRNNIPIDVWGTGWEGSVFNYHAPCTVEESFEIYKKAKIVLNEFIDDYCYYSGVKSCKKNMDDFFQYPCCQNKSCPKFKPKDAYCSDRLMISAYSGTPIMVTKKNGLESILELDSECIIVNKKNIVEKTKAMLNNKNMASEIGRKAQEKVRQFNFEKLLEKFLT